VGAELGSGKAGAFWRPSAGQSWELRSCCSFSPPVLTLPFPEPPQTSMPNRTTVRALLGAMIILGFMSGSVMMWMRKNNGMEESVAGCLMIVNQYTCTLCKRLPISGSVCRHSPYNKRQIHNGNGGSAQDSKWPLRGQRARLMLNTTDLQAGLVSSPAYNVHGTELPWSLISFFF
jgi:hypothetical protein